MYNELSDKIEFNTGRMYSDQGQRIIAEVIAKEDCNILPLLTVKFTDLDRMIEGVVEVFELTKEEIMHQYDSNQYTSADNQ